MKSNNEGPNSKIIEKDLVSIRLSNIPHDCTIGTNLFQPNNLEYLREIYSNRLPFLGLRFLRKGEAEVIMNSFIEAGTLLYYLNYFKGKEITQVPFSQLGLAVNNKVFFEGNKITLKLHREAYKTGKFSIFRAQSLLATSSRR